MANPLARKLTGEGVEIEGDPQSFFAGHGSVAIDLSLQRRLWSHSMSFWIARSLTERQRKLESGLTQRQLVLSWLGSAAAIRETAGS